MKIAQFCDTPQQISLFKPAMLVSETDITSDVRWACACGWSGPWFSTLNGGFKTFSRRVLGWNAEATGRLNWCARLGGPNKILKFSVSLAKGLAISKDDASAIHASHDFFSGCCCSLAQTCHNGGGPNSIPLHSEMDFPEQPKGAFNRRAAQMPWDLLSFATDSTRSPS